MKITLTKNLFFILVFISLAFSSCVTDTKSVAENQDNANINTDLPKSEIETNEGTNTKNRNLITAPKLDDEADDKNEADDEIAPQQNPINSQQKIEKVPTKVKADPIGTLPDACTLINEPFIGKTIKVVPEAITIKDGSGPSSTTARSCFFRWEHKGVPNSGVLIQIQKNPLPDEINDWAAYFIQAKVNSGDNDPTGGVNYKYKPVNDIGKAGAYSYDMHRYFFRTEEDIVFMVAFNIRATEEEELAWAKTIGKEALKNYKKL